MSVKLENLNHEYTNRYASLNPAKVRVRSIDREGNEVFIEKSFTYMKYVEHKDPFQTQSIFSRIFEAIRGCINYLMGYQEVTINQSLKFDLSQTGLPTFLVKTSELNRQDEVVEKVVSRQFRTSTVSSVGSDPELTLASLDSPRESVAGSVASNPKNPSPTLSPRRDSFSSEISAPLSPMIQEDPLLSLLRAQDRLKKFDKGTLGEDVERFTLQLDVLLAEDRLKKSKQISVPASPAPDEDPFVTRLELSMGVLRAQDRLRKFDRGSLAEGVTRDRLEKDLALAIERRGAFIIEA
jgi:hypothetical protein